VRSSLVFALDHRGLQVLRASLKAALELWVTLEPTEVRSSPLYLVFSPSLNLMELSAFLLMNLKTKKTSK
jgi:hypothetical protein